MREFSRRSALATAVATTTAVAITGVLILSESAAAQEPVTTPSGLKYIDTKVGTGAAPKTGQTCVMHYTGWLYDGGKKQLRMVAGVEAGDRGDFRLFGLRAGTYYLRATGLQVAPFELLDKGTVTYYPGVADSSRGVPIELHAGGQMSGFDIQLQSSGAYTHAPRSASGRAFSAQQHFMEAATQRAMA